VAIGWGKSYEDQVEEGNQRLSESERRTRLNEEERARAQRLESLRLSRSRVLEQLDRSRYPAHRESLLKGLQVLEQEIEELSGTKDRRP
jgi:ATPase subunit of ABC transporter with duplicated ATPase domains